MAKITRERAVREKRERKMEKKRAAAAERTAKANGTWVAPDETPGVDDLAVDDSQSTVDDPQPAVEDSQPAVGDPQPAI
jgi:hypothetical protein